jgi:Gluconate 2-dehydrogenase subunit 3
VRERGEIPRPSSRRSSWSSQTSARSAETLDRLLAGSRERQGLYARGLANFDRFSRNQYGRSFIALSVSEQTDLFREIERLADVGVAGASRAGQIFARFLHLYRRTHLPVVRLFPVLIDDVRRAFYTHFVSWQWLGYDGPPMPRGYLDLEHPRE